MNIVAIVLQILLALAFLFAGGNKIVGTKQTLQERDHLKIVPWFWRLTGVIEVVGAIGLIVGIWVFAVAVIAGILLAATMVGAFATHIWRRDSFGHAAVPLVLLVIALVIIIVRVPEFTSTLL